MRCFTFRSWPLFLLMACASEPRPLSGVGEDRFRDAAGKEVVLNALLGVKATVLITLDPECPFSRTYSTVLDSLSRAFEQRGVAFIGWYPTTFITPSAVLRFAADARMEFPQVMDPDCKLAHALNARVTPEAFVIDAEGTLRYRGAIDDSAVRPGRKKTGATQHHLAGALDRLIASHGSTVEVKAVGCIVECDKP